MGLNMIGYSIVAMVLILGATEAAEYRVGDSFGWNVPTNEDFYSEWASNKRFFLGDKLIFSWSGNHTVGIASEADYENCNTAISPFGGSGNGTVFQFTPPTPGPYYFICTIGNHCERGQKFSINVESSPNSDSPTAQPPFSSSSKTHSLGILSALVSTFAVFFFSQAN